MMVNGKKVSLKDMAKLILVLVSIMREGLSVDILNVMMVFLL